MGGGGGEGGGKLVGEGDFGFGSGGSGCLVGWLVRGERGVFGGCVFGRCGIDG